ncbi:SCAN domain-containing protein 3 isoform X1 [Belonocnema kinseyi]|uniref:SCAN domain-containing protein 3 isoform X1 n=1 Tax=Belonocnema kinseyi TaxID=2817044 RepID=UPI00143DC6B5|nr:SCAN domain-containing protein 3 isoform X1 [Belonocnema kinseyi]
MSANTLNTRNTRSSKRKRAIEIIESTESDSTCSGPSSCNMIDLETTPKTTQDALKFGFRFFNNHPQCLICYHTISNETLAGMTHHLKFSHPTLQKDPVSTFEKLLSTLESMTEEEISVIKKSWTRYTFERKISLEKSNPYIKFGARTLSNGCQQCLFCSRFFFSDSDYPKALQRHLRFNHVEQREQTIDFFIRKLIEVTKSQGVEIESNPGVTYELFIQEKEKQLIRFGFRSLQKGHVCMLCFKFFSNEYNRSSKMKNHLETKHPSVRDEPLEFFLRKIFETEEKSEFEDMIQYPMDDEELIKFGFRIYKEKVQCVLCAIFLKRESQYCPATLKNHMLYYHPKYKDSSVEYFKKMKRGMEKEKQIINRDMFLKQGFRVHNSKLQCIFCLEILTQCNLNLEELKRHLVKKHPLMVNAPIKHFKERLKCLGRKNPNLESDLHLHENCVRFGFRVYKDYYQCLVCLKGVTSRSTLNNFAKHYKTLHPEIVTPAEEFFKKKLLSLELSDAEKALLAKNIRPNFDYLPEEYEVPIDPVMIDESEGILKSEIETEEVKIEELINPGSVEEVDPIALSPIIISEEYLQLKEKLDTQFALQIDVPIFESISYLLTYVRFSSDEDIEEKLLFCKPLTDNNLLLTFLNAVQVYELDWNNCVAIYTDCSKSELSIDSIFVKQVQQMAPNASWCYGLIDLHSFITNKISNDLMIVLEDAVNITNFVKASTSRLSSVLNEKSGVFRQMLLHDTRYLSRGKVFNLLVELKREVAVFLTKEKFYLASVFSDPQWMIRLAYLSDIFSHLNDLVVSMEGKDKNVIVLRKTVEAFLKKLKVWISRMEWGHLESFPALWNLVEVENYKDYFKSTKNLFMDHLNEISVQLVENFLIRQLSHESSWILDPFSIDAVIKAGLQADSHQELWKLSNDQNLKVSFSEKTIAQFWISVKECFPRLAVLAADKLVPFSSSCLCELGFSSLMELKIEGGGGMNLERELMLNMNSSIVQML